MNDRDSHYMARCLELARGGYGLVHPNPMVGAVIVKDDTIIAEGYHQRFGGDHAEIDAINKAGEEADGATLYVNLEPCNHQGKTPPCTAAIQNAGIRKVVYAVDDPNPEVTGNGRRTLEKAGVEVVSGVLSNQAIALNEYFFFAMRSKLPFVILKAAITLDGYIADYRSRSKWITGSEARNHVQYLRRGVDAVLVGAHTVRNDNPQLTVRQGAKRQPYRIILDGPLLTPLTSKVYTDEFRDKTIVVCARTEKNRKKIDRLEKKGIIVLSYKTTKDLLPLQRIMRDLRKREITSILAEGGETVFCQFIEKKLFAKALFFIAPKFIGGGIPVVRGINRSLQNAYTLQSISTQTFGDDVLIQGCTELYTKHL